MEESSLQDVGVDDQTSFFKELNFNTTVNPGMQEDVEKLKESIDSTIKELIKSNDTSYTKVSDTIYRLVDQRNPPLSKEALNAKEDAIKPSNTLFQNHPNQPEVEMDPSKRVKPASILIYQSSTHPLKERILTEIAMKLPIPAAFTEENMQRKPVEIDINNLEMVSFIDTVEDLTQMALTIGSGILAVDLEAHSFESYWGITCLIQLSYGDKSYLVDAILLRQHIKAHLGPLLLRPSLLKVMHGSKGDIQWLQRDFDCHIYPLFDCQIALKHLGDKNKGGQLSLTALLTRYSSFTLDKGHQLSDWRRRPLSKEMMAYAHGDTVYLEYLFHRLLEDLGVKAGRAAFADSMLSSLKEWNYKADGNGGSPQWTEDSYLPVLKKELKGGASKNIPVDLSMHSKRVWRWREYCCRAEDSSPYSILPHHLCIRLAGEIVRFKHGNKSASSSSLRNLLETCLRRWGKLPFWGAIKHLDVLLADGDIVLPPLQFIDLECNTGVVIGVGVGGCSGGDDYLQKSPTTIPTSSSSSSSSSTPITKRTIVKRSPITISKTVLLKPKEKVQLKREDEKDINVHLLKEKVKESMLVSSNMNFVVSEVSGGCSGYGGGCSGGCSGDVNGNHNNDDNDNDNVQQQQQKEKEEFVINGKTVGVEDILFGGAAAVAPLTIKTVGGTTKKRRTSAVDAVAVDVDVDVTVSLDELAKEMLAPAGSDRTKITNSKNVDTSTRIATATATTTTARTTTNRLSNQPRQGNRSMTFSK